MAGPVSPLDETGRITWQEALGEEDLAKIDGVSFYETFFNIHAGDRDNSFAQAYAPPHADQGSETDIARGITNRGGWKLIHSMVAPATTVTKELYYLTDDPREFTDLYADATADTTDPSYNAVAAANLVDLEAQLAARLA